MKLQRLFPFLFAMLLFVSLTSCKDDDDNEPSQRDLLTTGQWNGVSVWAQGQDVTQLFIDEVEYDVRQESYRFDKNGEYRLSYTDFPTILGAWEFSNNETALLLDKGTNRSETVTISKLDANELYVVQTLQTEEGPLELEYRYRNQ